MEMLYSCCLSIGHDVGNVEAVPSISRIIFSEVQTQSLHLVDASSPQVPRLLTAAGNVRPTAFAVDRISGYDMQSLLFISVF